MPSADELPAFKEKRDVLFGENYSDEQRREMGRRFMEAEHYDDALEFFARCQADEDVRAIAEKAAEKANAPLYLRAMVVLGEDPDEDTLVSIADRAKEQGQLSIARVAHHKAGNKEKAEQIGRELLGGEEPHKVEKEDVENKPENNGDAIEEE
ncbi:MAG: hypothetical protein ACOCSQ_03195 [Planctomycetota bacterium]